MSDINSSFSYHPPFPLKPKETRYRLLTKDYVSVESFKNKDMLVIAPDALSLITNEALRDVSFLLSPEHLEQIASILSDPEASQNDKGVAVAMLRNAEVAAKFELPLLPGYRHCYCICKKRPAGMDRRQ
jgi:fumarate hydratase class I